MSKKKLAKLTKTSNPINEKQEDMQRYIDHLVDEVEEKDEQIMVLKHIIGLMGKVIDE